MLLARVCRAGGSPALASLLKSPVIQKPFIPRIQVSRLLASDGRSTFTRASRNRTTIKERAMAPAGEAAATIGKGAIAGASMVGIGALCYYGLGLSSSVGVIDYAGIWPDYVKERIRATYMYFGASVAASALSAAMCIRSPLMMNLVMHQGWLTLAGTLIAMIGSGIVVQNIPYKKGFGTKQMAWLVHTGIIGAVLAPLCLLGGPLVVRAVWYTAGVVGGLSAVAVCAPSEKFLNISGPMAIGLGVVLASAIGSMFLPPTTTMGSGLYAISLYGGLIVFSMFLLHDTQRIIKQAEVYPLQHQSDVKPYDPINNAISIYLDTVNIFVRILAVLSGNNRRK